MIPDRCPWFIAGPLLGLLIVALRATTNKPFGALGGYVELADHARTRGAIGFRAFLLGGLVLGGFLFAAVSRSFVPSIAYAGLPWETSGALELGTLVVAGVVMGFGARLAGGCTSGHGMSGMAIVSPASVAASMTFFGIAVLLAKAFAGVGGAR